MLHTDTAQSSPAIEVRDLRKTYGDRCVLRGLDLVVPRGVYALLGANGAGKTTLVGVLSTLLRPDRGSGSVRVCGHDVRSDPTAVRRAIAVTGQFAAVDELLTARENLRLAARLMGLSSRPAARRAEELLVGFDLTEWAGRATRHLSGGTRRRLDLAMSLVTRSELLFLDEPTTGLDPTSRRRLWGDVRALAEAGTTVVLTTQYLDEAEALADRVGVLAGGHLVAEGTPGELAATVGGEEAVLVGPDGALVRRLSTDGTATGLARALATVAEDERSLRVELRRPTLEDAFDVLTSSSTTPPTSANDAA